MRRYLARRFLLVIPTLLGVTMIIWASSFAGIRAGLESFSPGALVVFRFLIASAVLLTWVSGCRLILHILVYGLDIPIIPHLTPSVKLPPAFVCVYGFRAQVVAFAAAAGAAPGFTRYPPVGAVVLAAFTIQRALHYVYPIALCRSAPSRFVPSRCE